LQLFHFAHILAGRLISFSLVRLAVNDGMVNAAAFTGHRVNHFVALGVTEQPLILDNCRAKLIMRGKVSKIG
jgi:hypothetical protein